MYKLPSTIKCQELTDVLATAINDWVRELRETRRIRLGFGASAIPRPLDHRENFKLQENGVITDAVFMITTSEREGLDPVYRCTLRSDRAHSCIDKFYTAVTTNEPGITVTQYTPGHAVKFIFDPSARR